MRPRPRITHHSSSTLRRPTAFDTAPAASVNIAIPPRSRPHTSRTPEPSGAIVSGAALIHFIGKAVDGILVALHSPATAGGLARFRRIEPSATGASELLSRRFPLLTEKGTCSEELGVCLSPPRSGSAKQDSCARACLR